MTILWTPTALVATDDDNDRDRASDGRSRFGVYLRQHGIAAVECGEPLTAPEFAATVWRIATAPIMSPGYVRLRPDIAAVTPVWSEDGAGHLAFNVHVPLPHAALTARQAVPARWADWQRGPRDWEDSTAYRPLLEPERPGNSVLTTSVVRLAVTDAWNLPVPSTRPDHLVNDAKESVLAVADAVNRLAGPVVAALRGGRPC